MNYILLIKIAVATLIVTPYALVLLWNAVVRFGDSLPNFPTPRPLKWSLFAGGFITFDAMRDRFGSMMLWFPAFIFAYYGVSFEVAVCVLWLHILTALVIYLNRHRLKRLIPA